MGYIIEIENLQTYIGKTDIGLIGFSVVDLTKTPFRLWIWEIIDWFFRLWKLKSRPQVPKSREILDDRNSNFFLSISVFFTSISWKILNFNYVSYHSDSGETRPVFLPVASQSVAAIFSNLEFSQFYSHIVLIAYAGHTTESLSLPTYAQKAKCLWQHHCPVSHRAEWWQIESILDIVESPHQDYSQMHRYLLEHSNNIEDQGASNHLDQLPKCYALNFFFQLIIL